MRTSFCTFTLLTLIAILGLGCAQTKMTEPQRSATEQLLISTAADRAVESLSLQSFTNKKVFVDTNYFDGYDWKYAVGTFRDVLCRNGALMVTNVADSDIVIEPRTGAMSIDSSDSLIGLPKTEMPTPLAGALQIPEVALFKSQKQFSTAKIAFFAYDTHSGSHVYSSGPMVGRSYNKYYKFLGFIPYVSTDLPEKQKPKRKQKSDSDKK